MSHQLSPRLSIANAYGVDAFESATEHLNKSHRSKRQQHFPYLGYTGEGTTLQMQPTPLRQCAMSVEKLAEETRRRKFNSDPDGYGDKLVLDDGCHTVTGRYYRPREESGSPTVGSPTVPDSELEGSGFMLPTESWIHHHRRVNTTDADDGSAPEHPDDGDGSWVTTLRPDHNRGEGVCWDKSPGKPLPLRRNVQALRNEPLSPDDPCRRQVNSRSPRSPVTPRVKTRSREEGNPGTTRSPHHQGRLSYQNSRDPKAPRPPVSYPRPQPSPPRAAAPPRQRCSVAAALASSPRDRPISHAMANAMDTRGHRLAASQGPWSATGVWLGETASSQPEPSMVPSNCQGYRRSPPPETETATLHQQLDQQRLVASPSSSAQDGGRRSGRSGLLQDIAVVKTLRAPPVGVDTVMACVLHLLAPPGQPVCEVSWAAVSKATVGSQLEQRLRHLRLEEISMSSVDQVRSLLVRHDMVEGGQMGPDVMQTRCAAAAGILRWVLHVVEHKQATTEALEHEDAAEEGGIESVPTQSGPSALLTPTGGGRIPEMLANSWTGRTGDLLAEQHHSEGTAAAGRQTRIKPRVLQVKCILPDGTEVTKKADTGRVVVSPTM